MTMSTKVFTVQQIFINKRSESQSLKMFAISSLRGCRRLNSSIAALMSTGILRCTVRSVSPVSRCVVMADQKGVMIRFRLLKDLSAEQLVTGRVHRILSKALMFGNIEVACLRAAAGMESKLLYPCSFRCCCHFIIQQCSSEVTWEVILINVNKLTNFGGTLFGRLSDHD